MQILRSVAHIQPYFSAFVVSSLIFSLFMGGTSPHEIDWEAFLLHGGGYPYKNRLGMHI